MIDVNYWAVLGAVVASFVLGFLWYGPLFGKQWMAMMGFSKESMDEAKKKGMMKSYIIMIIGTFFTAYVLAHVVGMASLAGISSGFSGGLQSGFWMWLGFVGPVTLGSVLWENRSWKLWFLNNAYQLISLLMMGVILASWA